MCDNAETAAEAEADGSHLFFMHVALVYNGYKRLNIVNIVRPS
jgi:hypothetical protein